MSIIEIKKTNEAVRMDDIDIDIYEVPNEQVHIKQTIYVSDMDLFLEFIKKYWKDALCIIGILLFVVCGIVGLCKWHDYLWHGEQNPLIETNLVEAQNREFSDELKKAIKDGEIIPSEINVTTNNGNVIISDGRISCVVTHKDYTNEELQKFGTKQLRDQESARGYFFYYFDLIKEEE